MLNISVLFASGASVSEKVALDVRHLFLKSNDVTVTSELMV